jgi:hypothetical protein
MQEITFGRGSQATARLEQVNKTLAALSPGQYPNLVATSLAQPGRLARRFELGLTDLIQGLQQRIKAASQTAPAATRP